MILYIIENSECNVMKNKFMKIDGAEVCPVDKSDYNTLKKDLQMDVLDFPILETVFQEENKIISNVFMVNKFLNFLK